MWQFQVEDVNLKQIQKFTLFRHQQQLTYADVIDLWQNDSSFCVFFNSVLADSPFLAYFWETPPITLSTIKRNFEFVLVNNPKLSQVKPNYSAFKKYFTSALNNQTVVTFSNLGKDATLVVPCPCVDNSAYTHIANFVRQAPSFQQIALWQTVGTLLHQNIDRKNPLWVSTSGLGVYWLHIRLDSYPKYYTFQPYKKNN